MFIGTVGQKHAAARRNLECPGGMLVRTHPSQETQPDLRTGECACVVDVINLSTLPGVHQHFIAMEAKSIAAGKLLENDLSAQRPFAVGQEVPIAAADL